MGTVEKFIGDAVMAVFGVPQLHEDDALRAVRAALEMQAALHVLNEELHGRWNVELSVRIGVNSGEVVAGDAAGGQVLATGDAVNTAARLEQAAQPGEVLIGEQTHKLVRHTVTAEPSQPIAAKGKSQPLVAWRLRAVELGSDPLARQLDQPIVGRHRELRLLTDAAERVTADRSCALVTVLGTPGVGKSRLVHEFLQRVRGGESGRRVIRGRCLSYGEAVTYWPLLEALREAADIEPSDDEAVTRQKPIGPGARGRPGRGGGGPRVGCHRPGAGFRRRRRGGGGDLLGGAPAAGGDGRRTSASCGVRRHPVGDAHLP